MSNAERKQAAQLSRATLCLWCWRCSAHPYPNSKFEVKWSVHKSVDGQFELDGFPDNDFQINEYSPAVSEYLATTYLREREEDTVGQLEQEYREMIAGQGVAYNDFAAPPDVVNNLKRGRSRSGCIGAQTANQRQLFLPVRLV